MRLNNTAANPQFHLTSADNGISELKFGDQSDLTRAVILYRSGSAGDALCFNGYNNTERVRIDSSGRVRIANTDITTSSAADDLIIGPNTPAGDRGITIFSGTAGTGNIYFGDTDTSGLGNRMGTISYYHNENYMRFSTNGNQERLRITSGGNVRVTSGVIENSNTISSNYTVSTNFNAMSAGPMSIASGVSVTVPSGSAWTIV